MEQANYFHATLYRFNINAVKAVIDQFVDEIDNASAICWYDNRKHMFCLECPNTIGSTADAVLCNILSNYNDSSVVQRFSGSTFDRDNQKLDEADLLREDDQNELKSPENVGQLSLHVISGGQDRGKKYMFFKLHDLPEGTIERVLAPAKGSYQPLNNGFVIRPGHLDAESNCYVREDASVPKAITSGTPGLAILPAIDFVTLKDKRHSSIATMPTDKFISLNNEKDEAVTSGAIVRAQKKHDGTVPHGSNIQDYFDGIEGELLAAPESKREPPKDAKQFMALSDHQTVSVGRTRVAKGKLNTSSADSHEILGENRIGTTSDKEFEKLLDNTPYLCNSPSEPEDLFALLTMGVQPLRRTHVTEQKKQTPSLFDVILPQAPQKEQEVIHPAANGHGNGNPVSEKTSVTRLKPPSVRGLLCGEDEAFPTFDKGFAKCDHVGLTADPASQARWELDHQPERKDNGGRRCIQRRQLELPQSTATSLCAPQAADRSADMPERDCQSRLSFSGACTSITSNENRRDTRTGLDIDALTNGAVSRSTDSNSTQSSTIDCSHVCGPDELPYEKVQPLQNVIGRKKFTMRQKASKKKNEGKQQSSQHVQAALPLPDPVPALGTRLQRSKLRPGPGPPTWPQLPISGPIPSPYARPQLLRLNTAPGRPIRPQPPTPGLILQQKSTRPPPPTRGSVPGPSTWLPPSSQDERTSSDQIVFLDSAHPTTLPKLHPGFKSVSLERDADGDEASTGRNNLAKFIDGVTSPEDLESSSLTVMFGHAIARNPNPGIIYSGWYNRVQIEKKFFHTRTDTKIDFFSRMTTSEADARYMLGLLPGVDIDTSVEYEFHVKDLHGQRRMIRANQWSLDDYKIYETGVHIRALHKHYPDCQWDTRATIDRVELAKDVMTTPVTENFLASIQSTETLPSFLVMVPTPEFWLEKVYVRRHYDKIRDGLQLRVSEVFEPSLAAVKSPDHNMKATAWDKDEMIRLQRYWWEGSARLTNFRARDFRDIVDFEYAVNEIVPRLDVVGVTNKGPYLSFGPVEPEQVDILEIPFW